MNNYKAGPRGSIWWRPPWNFSFPFQSFSSVPQTLSTLLSSVPSLPACRNHSGLLPSPHRMGCWAVAAKNNPLILLLYGPADEIMPLLTCRSCCWVWMNSLHCCISSLSLSVSSSWSCLGITSSLSPACTMDAATQNTQSLNQMYNVLSTECWGSTRNKSGKDDKTKMLGHVKIKTLLFALPEVVSCP